MLVIQFTEKSEGEGAEFSVYVLNAIYSHGTAKDIAHIGFDRHANNLNAFLRLNEGNDIAKMACRKIADIIPFFAHICSARVSIGNDEHDPAFGAALLEPLVAPHGGFAAVTEIVHPGVQDGAQPVHC